MAIYRLKPCDGPCPPSGFDYSPCDMHFIVEIHWPEKDLDTGVVYTANDKTSGYSCDNDANPFFQSDDVTEGTDLKEIHHVSVKNTDLGGDEDPKIIVSIHWFDDIPDPNPDVTIYVKEGARTESYTTKAGLQASGCSCNVGEQKVIVTIPQDRNWTFETL
jgi:hypothetical protein